MNLYINVISIHDNHLFMATRDCVVPGNKFNAMDDDTEAFENHADPYCKLLITLNRYYVNRDDEYKFIRFCH